MQMVVIGHCLGLWVKQPEHVHSACMVRSVGKGRMIPQTLLVTGRHRNVTWQLAPLLSLPLIHLDRSYFSRQCLIDLKGTLWL